MKRTRIRIKKGSTVVGMALVMAAALVPGIARAQDAGVDYTNTVTVASGATVEMEADIATITFGVRAANKDAAVATRALAVKTQSVVDSLLASGVTEDELTVGSVRLGRRTDRQGNFLRYVASSQVKVKTDRLDGLGDIIEAAVNGGASSIGRLSYDVADRSGAVDQALREAMAFARAKATALAESENRQVGPALVISEYDSRPPRAVSFDGGGGSGGIEAAAGALAASIPLIPPTLEARARITVTFVLI